MNVYSQNDEQQVTLEFFKGRTGRFLDIGAFDGVTFSNTRALLESGWAGVFVEPSPRNLVKLLTAVNSFLDRAIVIAAAIGEGDGSGWLHLDEAPGREWAASLVPQVIGRIPSPIHLRVPVMEVNRLSFFGPYDFLSLDAEGMDFEILRAMKPAFLAQFELMSVEPLDLREREQMKEWFAARAFVVHHETPENLIVRRT